MEHTLTPCDSGSAPKSPKDPWTISLVHARAKRDMAVAKAPESMNGTLFPYLMRQLSLRIPTYGWTRVPDKGPAIHTKARSDLLIPRDRRYGYSGAISQSGHHHRKQWYVQIRMTILLPMLSAVCIRSVNTHGLPVKFTRVRVEYFSPSYT